jgi:hypothetical protein
MDEPATIKLIVPDDPLDTWATETEESGESGRKAFREIEIDRASEPLKLEYVDRWRRLPPRTRDDDVPTRRLKAELDRAQGEIHALLGGVATHDAGGFRLSEVQVSLAIQAGGTIGIATLDAEASIALTYARRDAPN